MSEILSEAEVSMLLDLYMYTDYAYAKDNMTLNEIIEEMPQYIDVKETYFKEYSILSEAVENPQIGELKICMQSRNMGYNEGTNAVTFINPKNNNTYIVFRGTADGEWLDNGKGMTQNGTIQQKQALAYFDNVVNRLKLTGNEALYVSGHSKGGNKVQYITMESKNYKLIDACYSVDGQGHSDVAIKEWKDRYSKKEYKNRVEKIYGINGENDFVSPLGCGIILASHISYVKTAGLPTDFANYHDLTAMYATNFVDSDGKMQTSYSAKRNAYTFQRGEFGDFIANLSENIMALPLERRDGCAFSLMQSIEKINGGRKNGVNGEKASFSDYYDLLVCGIPTIANSFGKNGGKELFMDFLKKKCFDRRMSSSVFLKVNYISLAKLAKSHIDEIKVIEQDINKISGWGNKIPLLFAGRSYRAPQIETSVEKLENRIDELKKLATTEVEVAIMYKDFDNNSLTLV